MSKTKLIPVRFSIWDQHWHGEVWAQSVAHARRNFIQEVINGPDKKNRLRVQVREGDKEIVFFDRIFKVGDNRQWPDDMGDFLEWARQALRSQLKAERHVKPGQLVKT